MLDIFSTYLKSHLQNFIHESNTNIPVSYTHLIPFPVIVRAADGDIEAVNQIVRHYSGFIASRSMRPMKDEYGNTHMVVDETLRRRMETRLIAKILSFEIRESN